MKKQKVYVGCAITYVPDAQKNSFSLLLSDIKKELKDKGFEVLDFLSAIKVNPKPAEVYNFDIKCLNDCDCMLALGDFPGIGLGYEICYATELRKIPTMICVKNLDNLSKLLKGVPKKNYKFIVSENAKEIVNNFSIFINSHYEENN